MTGFRLTQFDRPVWSGFQKNDIYIYIYIIGEIEKNSNYNFKLKFQFCVMCIKLFIIKEFYFLILESNVRPHYKYSSNWVIKNKNQRV